MEVSDHLNDSSFLTPERSLLILSSGRLDGFQGLSGLVGEEINLSPCLELYRLLSTVQSIT
jgi:hypothetical protein